MATRRSFLQAAGLTGSWLSASAFGGDPVPGKSIRSQFLLSRGLIYFNTGSLGPSPMAVVQAVERASRSLEQDPVSQNWGPLGEAMESVRGKVASFINGSPADVVLTRNTTEGLSMVAQSLALNAGDELITTTLEHGGAEVGLEQMVSDYGAVLRRADIPLNVQSSAEVVRAVIAQVTPKTRGIWLSHVNTATGMVMPFPLLADACRKQGILLVADGAQAVGNVPVDVQALGVDAFACSGHKWLFGPKETGFLWTRPGFSWARKPVFIRDGYGTYTRSSGTRNVSSFIGLGAALDWHREVGLEAMIEHARSLRSRLEDQMADMGGLEVISPRREDLTSAIFSISLTRSKNAEVYQALRKVNIVVKVLPQHNALRISCCVFNTPEEIDELVKQLKKLV